MNSKPKTTTPSLFDIIEKEEAREHPETCPHETEKKTYTIWPGETFERMTWTCERCGRVRGRC